MTLRDKLKQLIKEPATHWIYERIPPDRTTMKEKENVLEPNRCYFRIKLTQMFLGFKRVWVQKRMPIVHAFPRFLHSQGFLELPVIIGPNRLKDLDGGNLEKVISLNQTIIGPVTYFGGDVELIIGLFAAETKNFAEQFFNLADSLSDLVPSMGVKTALDFLRPVELGLEAMLGLKTLSLQVGVQDTFSSPSGGHVANPLRSGYRVLIAKDEDDINPSDLWLTERGLRLDKDGKLLTKCDYIVFKVEKLLDRDWRELPSLNTAWRKVEEAVRTGEDEVINAAFKMFKWTLLGCADLLPKKRRLVLKEQVDELQETLDSGDIQLKRRFLTEEFEATPEVAELLQPDLRVASKIDWRKGLDSG